VQHDLIVKNLMNQISICKLLLKRNEIKPFLKWLITGDEKWITYNEKDRGRSFANGGQARIDAKKSDGVLCVCVCVCSCARAHACVDGGIGKESFYELLPPGQTIDSNSLLSTTGKITPSNREKATGIDQ